MPTIVVGELFVDLYSRDAGRGSKLSCYNGCSIVESLESRGLISRRSGLEGVIRPLVSLMLLRVTFLKAVPLPRARCESVWPSFDLSVREF